MQRQSQRHTTVLGILLLLVGFATAAVLAGRAVAGTGLPFLRGERVAVLPIVGVLESESRLLRDLERFRRDAGVRAFVLEIRSPGGGVGASQSLYRALRTLREEDDRPLVAWIGAVGASGGYYVALPADSIFSLPGSITGSIGVILQFPDATELARRVGVGLEVVKSGRHKDMGSPLRELSEEERAILQRLVDDVHEQFVAAVAEARGLDRGRVLDLADGSVFSGARALELGLVDGTSTLQEAIDVAGRMAGIGDDPPVVRPPERRLTLWDVITGMTRETVEAWTGLRPPGAASTPRLLYQWK